MEDNVKIITYPAWVKDDIDKIIHEEFQINNINGKVELTFTQIKNRVFSRVFEKMASESLISRLIRLKEKGILQTSPKKTEIEIWKVKEAAGKSGSSSNSKVQI